MVTIKIIIYFRGLDFRPDFRELGLLRSIIQAPVVALSATVTEAIRADIFRYLVLDESTTDIVSVIPDRLYFQLTHIKNKLYVFVMNRPISIYLHTHTYTHICIYRIRPNYRP